MQKVMWEPTGRTVSKDDRVSQGAGFITHKGTEMWPGPNEVRDLKLRLLQKAEIPGPSHSERRIRKTLLSAQGSWSFPQALRRKKKDYVGDFNPQWAMCDCGDLFNTAGCGNPKVKYLKFPRPAGSKNETSLQECFHSPG